MVKIAVACVVGKNIMWQKQTWHRTVKLW